MKQSLIALGVFVFWVAGALLALSAFSVGDATAAILGMGLMLYALVWNGLEKLIAGQREHNDMFRAMMERRRDAK